MNTDPELEKILMEYLGESWNGNVIEALQQWGIQQRIDELEHITVTSLDNEEGAWYEPDEGYQITLGNRIATLQSQLPKEDVE